MFNSRKTSGIDEVSEIYGLVTMPFAGMVAVFSGWMMKHFLTSSPNPEHTYAFVVGAWIVVGAVLNMFSGFTAAAARLSFLARELILMCEISCLILASLMIGDPDSLTFLGGTPCGFGFGAILFINAIGCRYGARR